MSLSKLFRVAFIMGTALWSLAADRPYDALIERGHYKQARILLEKALIADPNDATAMMQLAFIKLEFNEVPAATSLAERAVSLKPKDAQAHAVLADCYGQAAENAGMFEGLSLSRAFRKDVEAALAIDPKNYEALHSYMQYYLEAPAIAGGSKSKAREMAERIAAVDAYKGARARIEIALHENQRDHLLELYQKAVEADPESYDGLVAIASLYASQNWRDLAKAEEYAKHAIRVDPGRGMAFGILAQVKALNEQWSELDQVLAQAEQSVPDNLVYYFRAGLALLATGKDNARAEKYFRKYLTQPVEGGMPSLAQGHWQLGLALEKQGRKQEAAHEIEVAVQMDPQLKAAKNDLKRIKS